MSNRPDDEASEEGNPSPSSPEFTLPYEIIKEVEEAGIDSADPEIHRAMVVASKITRHSHSGPLPPAESLSGYEEVVPGLAKQIVEWAQSQHDHRLFMERTQVLENEKRLNRGQIISACIAVPAIIGAAIVGIVGSPWAAGVIVIVGVGGPAAATILARSLSRSED